MGSYRSHQGLVCWSLLKFLKQTTSTGFDWLQLTAWSTSNVDGADKSFMQSYVSLDIHCHWCLYVKGRVLLVVMFASLVCWPGPLSGNLWFSMFLKYELFTGLGDTLCTTALAVHGLYDTVWSGKVGQQCCTGDWRSQTTSHG